MKDGQNGSARTRVEETIESIAEIERRAIDELSTHQRWIERATTMIGRPRAVYTVATFVTAWMGANLILATAGRAFDAPPFYWLQGIVSLAALFMTIFILTTGNRANLHDVRRDRLDLQINLLTERKISKVIEMLEALRRDTPAIPDRNDPEARELRRSVDPHEVVRAIDERTPE
ncbi:MAG: DUF1003 domain-containing protein [Candidatus Velthaea sp.]